MCTCAHRRIILHTWIHAYQVFCVVAKDKAFLLILILSSPSLLWILLLFVFFYFSCIYLFPLLSILLVIFFFFCRISITMEPFMEVTTKRDPHTLPLMELKTKMALFNQQLRMR